MGLCLFDETSEIKDKLVDTVAIWSDTGAGFCYVHLYVSLQRRNSTYNYNNLTIFYYRGAFVFALETPANHIVIVIDAFTRVYTIAYEIAVARRL